MFRAADHPTARRVSRAVRVVIFLTLTCLMLPWPAAPAQAAGSRNVTKGWRPFIEWHNSATSGGIPRQTTIKAYARAGEQIFVGSSAMNIGPSGTIRFYSPTGVPGDCKTLAVGQPADYGRIDNITEEQAGPLPNANGYRPCVISAAQTLAPGGAGIWEFEFISPDPNAAINNDPTPLLITDPWTQANNRHWTNAWDISVRDATTGLDVPGRVFAKYLAYNLGGNATATGARSTLGLDAPYWIVTYDGYGYQVNMNGIDPFGFIFFSNAEGVVDARGVPTYRSFQLVGTPPNVSLPTGYSVYNPGLPDVIDQKNITHKIFFEEPDPNLPAAAPSREGNVWLLPATQPPPTVTNFRFTGVEGTPGQAGTAPLGGNFTFDAPAGAAFSITIDTDRNGVFGDNNDRKLTGTTFTSANIVYWNALDGAGAPVPAGPLPYNAQIKLGVGEVHFPFVDAENNKNGIQLVRFRGSPGAADADLVYYNDAFTYTGASAYDYSPCATGDTPAPPAAAYPAPLCFGSPSAQRSALDGVHSTSILNPTQGAHEWTRNAVGTPSVGFGDRRLIDTWAKFEAPTQSLPGGIVLAEAELSSVKTRSPAVFIPGGQVTYTIRVTNNGPSAAVGAKVSDQIPTLILNPTWTCAITTGTGACATPTGVGNNLDTTVNLSPGAVATYTIIGTLSPKAAGRLRNLTPVERPKDNTDPDLGNNIGIDDAPILAVADLELNKTIATPPPIAANSQVEFAIELRNRGPAGATGVEVEEKLPAGLSFVSATATQGTYNSTTGAWAVGSLPADGVATLSLRALWNGGAVKNTAQVSKSDQPDPDSTPGNGVAGEDDQSSASLPLQIADLELTKVVDAPRVNVGSNVVFTIEVTNKGPDGATGVRVSDQLPAGLGFVRATPSQGTYTLASGTWAIGSVANGAKVSLRIEATVLGPGPFVNTAQVSGSDQYDPDSDPNNDNPREDDQAFATVGGDIADLSLSKDVDNTQPPFNGTVAYTVALRNDGPSAATGVAVSDKLPAGLTFVSATPSQGTYSSTSGVWLIGAVPANGGATLTIRARVVSGAPIRNTAQVSASDQPDPDSTPGNGDPSEDDQAGVTLTPQLADLSLTKTVNNTAPSVGGEVVFTIAVKNDGPSAASGVEVSEPLPAGLIYVSNVASRGAYNPASGAWTIGGIGLGETVTLDLRVRLNGVGPFTNTAQISKSDQPDLDSTPGNGNPSEDDQASVQIGGTMADLSVVKRVDSPTLPASGIVNFTIEVRNSGPSAATGVTLGERLPAGATVLTSTPSKGTYGGANTWTVGGLAVGERATLTLSMRLVGPGPFVNTAEVTGSDQFDPDSTPGNGAAGEDDQASAAVNVGPAPAPGVADLRLTKAATTLGKLPNSAAFLITVINQGPDTATNVEVSEPLHPDLSFISASPSQGSYNASTGTWVIGTIPNGGVVTLQIFTLVTTDKQITNTAQVSRSDQFDPDSTPGNGVAGEDDQASVAFSRTTAVTLAGFSAERQAKGVLLRWSTGAELNSLGFQLYRSAGGGRDGAELVTPQLIPARGGPATGASYSFLDADVEPGASYSYWLVEQERGGATSEYGPARAAGLDVGKNQVYLMMIIR